jgi:15-cis-phytoene synthase
MNSGARHELAAAGIGDPILQQGYLHARRLNARHGRTYFLATWLLPPEKRPFVHALYGFARYADDIVDLPTAETADDRANRLQRWADAFVADLDRGASADPICHAVIDTINRWGIPASYFIDFLESMRTDLTVTEYATYDDLRRYMWGSAAVIGLQMLPILGQANDSVDTEMVRSCAIDLGLAFQLTNFIRDIAEDLDRGRIYLPQDSLRRFGVTRDDLRQARVTATTTAPIRRLIAFEAERARLLYRSARPGIDGVHPASRECLHTALALYREILDRIAEVDYNVFAGRVSVGLFRRGRVAVPALLRARAHRRRSRLPARSGAKAATRTPPLRSDDAGRPRAPRSATGG